MIISYKNNWLKKICNSNSYAKRELGADQAAKLKVCMDDLDAADCLSFLRALTHLGCHELGQNRKGQLAVFLKQPYRLIFVPHHRPLLKKDDGGLDWDKVTEILIIEITDYH